MATRSALLRIHDMLESIRGIEKAIAGKHFAITSVRGCCARRSSPGSKLFQPVATSALEGGQRRSAALEEALLTLKASLK
jgi:hypothetical protein